MSLDAVGAAQGAELAEQLQRRRVVPARKRYECFRSCELTSVLTSGLEPSHVRCSLRLPQGDLLCKRQGRRWSGRRPGRG
jgi:hypothetical protein